MTTGTMVATSETRVATSERWVRVALIVALVALIGIPLLGSFVNGGHAAPFGDDWAYLKMTLGWERTGELTMVGWNDVNFVGLLPPAWLVMTLFGPSISSINLVGLLACALAIIGAWRLLHRSLPTTWALFGLVVVVTLPGLGYSGWNFLTDAPAIAAQLWTLDLAISALERQGRARFVRLALALLVGFVAVTIRQLAVLAPLTVLVVALVFTSGRERRKVIGLGLAFLVVTGVFQLWRGSFENAGVTLNPPRFEGPALELARTFLLLALFVLPVLLAGLGAWALRGRRRWLVVGIGAGLSALAALVIHESGREVFIGSGFTPSGALIDGAVNGSRPALVPIAVWAVAIAVACLTIGLLLAWVWPALVERWKARQPAGVEWSRARAGLEGDPEAAVLGLFAVATLPLAVASLVFTYGLADRYLVVAFTCVVVLALRALHRRGASAPSALALGVVGVLAVLSLTMVWDSQSFASAKWEAGQKAEALGFPAGTIDAGFEWVGFHYPGLAQEDVPALPADGFPTTWYHDYFPRFDRQVLVLPEPIDQAGLRLIATERFSTWFGLGEGKLYLYEITST